VYYINLVEIVEDRTRRSFSNFHWILCGTQLSSKSFWETV